MANSRQLEVAGAARIVDFDSQLPGVTTRTWPVVREVLLVMLISFALILMVAPGFSLRLFVLTPLRTADSPLRQLRVALVGGALATAAFSAIFLCFVVLYVWRWESMLYSLHSVWIGTLLGPPLALLLLSTSIAFAFPMDIPTLMFIVWNLTASGVLVVHWSATAAHFEFTRQLHADVIASLSAWVFAAVPYQTALAVLLLFAALDVLFVSLPGAPVQRLDTIASSRRRIGETQMPGLTFKRVGLELGFGDFLVYGAFSAQAACASVAAFAAVFAAVAVGLVLTMVRITLAPFRVVLPALPLAVAMATSLLGFERLLLQPLIKALCVERVCL